MDKGNLTTPDTDVLSGFTAVADYISDPNSVNDLDNNTVDDIDKIGIDKDDDIDDNDDINDTDDIDVDDDNADDADDGDSDDIGSNSKDSNDSGNADDIDDTDDVDEKDIVEPFIDLFAEELGWEMDDEDKPKSIGDLVEFMNDLVSKNSAPTYANEEIKKLDDFVRMGGDIKNYFEQTASGVNLDNLDLSNESAQKSVIREYLRESGHSDKYIERKLNRYEESGTLEEEAEDTVELLKETYKKKEEKLLQEQEKRYQLELEKQQKFVSTVEDSIEKLDNLFGIPVNTAQKKELKDYLLKVDAQGRTKYQVNYSKDPVTRLIQQAFIDINGDKMVKNLQTKGQNDAVSKFKSKIKNSGNKKRGKDQRRYNSKGGSFDLVSAVSSQLM